MTSSQVTDNIITEYYAAAECLVMLINRFPLFLFILLPRILKTNGHVWQMKKIDVDLNWFRYYTWFRVISTHNQIGP